jgi:signal transduction histidine kinase/ActR/RegA family two-component response regulator
MYSTEQEIYKSNADETIQQMVDAVPGISSDTLCEQLHFLFDQYHADSLVVVKDGISIGILVYRKVADLLSTQFGFALYQKRSVVELMDQAYMSVELNTLFHEFVERALARDKDTVYEDIVVTEKGKYVGLLSISRVLLEQHKKITLQVEKLEQNKLDLTEGNLQLSAALENLKNAEAQLIRAEKMASIGTLSAGIAHDFNNMMAAILSSIQMMRTRIDSQSNLIKYCDIIEKATIRASDLTRQLLQFSQKNFVQFKSVSLNVILDETIKMFKRSLNKNIDLHVTLDEHLPQIEADEGQIQQVLMNLALNARDAMSDGGILSFTTSLATLDEKMMQYYPDISPGVYVKLTVQDTGCGIPKEHLSKIFDPFFSTKDIGKGTGLGLSVVYGIIKKHKGHVNVYSQIGVGTSFSIYFKPIHSSNDVNPESLSRVKRETGSGTVLMIDDEEMLLDIHSESLKELGYDVIVASGGVQGIELYRQHVKDIDIVLLDMMMPELDGKETFRRLKDINGNVKVLFISGYTDEERFKNIMTEGALGLIRKPFDTAVLSRKIKEVILQDELFSHHEN